jgi:hypothetical protein
MFAADYAIWSNNDCLEHVTLLIAWVIGVPTGRL